MTGSNAFDAHLARWRAWADEPWGRLRFAVVRQTVGWQVAALGGGPLRVLDVGGGDARDSLPLALAGHHVTVVDTAPGMLVEAARRAEDAGVPHRIRIVEAGLDDLADVGDGFDLVLCHFLLHYRRPEDRDLDRLAAALREGGRLSVIAPNPDGLVLQRLVRGGPAAALEELASPRWRTTTFEEEGRKLSHTECAAAMVTAGLDVVALYGGRCANDLLVDDAAKLDADYFSALQQLELTLCDREPFKRIGAFWQLVARKGAPDD